jgi:hypothetical protein
MVVFVVSVRFPVLEASQQMYSNGVKLQSHAQPPTWRTSLSLFGWVITFDLSDMRGPTSSYATASISPRRGLLVACCGHFSGRSPCHSGIPQVPVPKKVLLTEWSDCVVLTKNVSAT